MDNSAVMGQYLIDSLRSISSDKIVEVRGRGLMIGIVMDGDSAPYRKQLLQEHRIFVGSASDNRVIRLLPSLTITREVCDRFIDTFKTILK